jgi:uncharacterized damage-inducible protein DinB
MTERSVGEPEWDAGRAFIERSRSYLVSDYPARIRVALKRLPEADLWWRPNDASNSVGNLLLHLAGNARQWIVSGVGGRPDERRRDTEFAAREGLTAVEAMRRLESALAEVDEVLLALTPDALSRTLRIQGLRVTALDAIYHVVEHFSMHTGQILYVVKLRTGADLGLWHVREDGTASPAWGPSALD